MSKKMLKVSAVFVAVVALLVCFTSCSNGVEGASTGFVRFDGERDFTRSVSQVNDDVYRVEDLYWTYTAKKIDGLYTEGESVKADATHVNPGSGSTVYVERPVKQGPATGLDGKVGPFATGDWTFEIYGYANCKVVNGALKFDTLIYKGVTSPASVAVKSLGGADVPSVVFVLTQTDSVPADGKLVIELLNLTLPEDYGLFAKDSASLSGLTAVDSALKVRIWDITDGWASKVLIATSTNAVNADLKAGDTVCLAPFVIEAGKDSVNVSDSHKGTRIFAVSAEYQDRYTKYASENIAAPAGSTIYTTHLYNWTAGTPESHCYENGWAAVGSIVMMPVQFYAGTVTTLSGNLNDISGIAEDAPDGLMNVPVARVLKSGVSAATATDNDYDYFTSLQAAYNATTATNNVIELLADVQNETLKGNTTHNVKISLGLNRLKNFLWVPGGDYSVSLVPYASDVLYFMTLGGHANERSMIKDLHYGATSRKMWLESDGGVFTSYLRGWDVWHTGVADYVTIYAAGNAPEQDIGYHVHCDVKQALTTTLDSNVTAYSTGFYLELGSVNINWFQIDNLGTYRMKGSAGTKIRNINDIRDAEYWFNGRAIENAFVKVILHGNNVAAGKTAEDTKVTYAISGVPYEFPDCDSYGNSPLFTKLNMFFDYWKIGTATDGTVNKGVKIFNNTAATLTPMIVDAVAQWMNNVVASTGTKGIDLRTYNNLRSAVEACKGDVTLWKDLTGVGSIHLFNDDVKIITQGFDVSGVVLDSEVGSRTMTFVSASNGTYGFSGNGASINFVTNTGNNISVATTGGNLVVKAPGDVVTHTGSVNALMLNEVQNDTAKVNCYNFNGTVSDTLTVKKGLLKFGANANVKKLEVLPVASSDVALVGTTTTIIGNMNELRDSGISETPALTEVAKSAFSKVVLNGGAVSDHRKVVDGAYKSIVSQLVYLYGIEGMYMDLPLMVDSTRNPNTKELALFNGDNSWFKNWTTGSGEVYKDAQQDAFVVPPVGDDLTLVANWNAIGLCITAEEPGCAVYTQFWKNKNTILYNNADFPRAQLMYSTDLGVTWNDYTASVPSADGTSYTHGQTINLANIGDKVIFKAKTAWQTGADIDHAHAGEPIYGSKKHTATGNMRDYGLPYGSFWTASTTTKFANSFIFTDDKNLTVVTFGSLENGDSSALTNIFTRAFCGCSSLKYVRLVLRDATVVNLGTCDYLLYAGFINCYNLECIVFSGFRSLNGMSHALYGDCYGNVGRDSTGVKYYVRDNSFNPPYVPSGFKAITFGY